MLPQAPAAFTHLQMFNLGLDFRSAFSYQLLGCDLRQLKCAAIKSLKIDDIYLLRAFGYLTYYYSLPYKVLTACWESTFIFGFSLTILHPWASRDHHQRHSLRPDPYFQPYRSPVERSATGLHTRLRRLAMWFTVCDKKYLPTSKSTPIHLNMCQHTRRYANTSQYMLAHTTNPLQTWRTPRYPLT